MNKLQEAIKYFKRVKTNKDRIKPTFIIIGAVRSGTTSLYEYLENHPNVLPPIKKETAFFNYAYHENPKWYRMYFPSIYEKIDYHQSYEKFFISGEATPAYLIDPRVPSRISKILPDIKLIILLRNPIDRALSHFHHNVLTGIEKLSFEQSIKSERDRINSSFEKIKKEQSSYNENSISYFLRMLRFKPETYFKFSYLHTGHYFEHLKNWFNVFSKEQLMIIKSEDFFDQPKMVFRQVQEFLGLQYFELERYWHAWEIKYPPMDNDLREYLKKYFAPHNQKLYKFLNRDLHWE